MNNEKRIAGAWTVLLVLATCVTGTGSARAAAVLINQTCQVGDCSASNLLATGASVTEPFSLDYTFANTDRYRLTGTLGAVNDSSSNGIIEITAADLVLTYVGNASNSVSSTDTLVVDFVQYFRTPFPPYINNSGYEYVDGVFGGPLAHASTVEAQAYSNGGTAMALMGPFDAPDAFSASNANQRFAGGPTSLIQFRDTITFGTGSGIGATVVVSNVPAETPEPSSALLLVAGAFFLLAKLTRR